MLEIIFYPESDKEKYITAANEYTLVWQTHGEQIVKTIEKRSELSFLTNHINALVFDGISYSFPLQLNYNLTKEEKFAELTHELIHRLLDDHGFWFDVSNMNEEVHKAVYLLLYDIWIDLFGKQTAETQKNREVSYGDPDYKTAWEWALSFSTNERKDQFSTMTKKYKGKAPR